MNKLPPSSPFSHKLVVSTVAVVVGFYAAWHAGRDFQFIRFEPHSPEEVEKRKRENARLQMRQLDSRTLDYTPEAKERMRRKLAEPAEKPNEER